MNRFKEDQQQADRRLSVDELSAAIRDNGGWEEFHQKKIRDPQANSGSHWLMYDYHKNRRLELEAEYRRRKAAQ